MTTPQGYCSGLVHSSGPLSKRPPMLQHTATRSPTPNVAEVRQELHSQTPRLEASDDTVNASTIKRVHKKRFTTKPRTSTGEKRSRRAQAFWQSLEKDTSEKFMISKRKVIRQCDIDRISQQRRDEIRKDLEAEFRSTSQLNSDQPTSLTSRSVVPDGRVPSDEESSDVIAAPIYELKITALPVLKEWMEAGNILLLTDAEEPFKPFMSVDHELSARLTTLGHAERV